VAFIASIVPEQLKWISDRYSAVMSKKDHPNNAPGVPMVFPVWFENLQVKYLNSALKPIARYLPGTGTIEHRGRKSGKSYKTIVTAYRKENVLAIALAHGKTDWVKNVLAAGDADLHYARRVVHITNPRILPAGSDGPAAAGLPWLARVQLRRMAVFVADIA
jgi:deazaflavin-dependent oxidoreductase (nitroreductase family)